MFGRRRKKMLGPDGKTEVNRLSWEEYGKWQRWDEWPERADNPPLTVETVFWYKDKSYIVTTLNHQYVILEFPEWNEVLRSDNFLELLDIPYWDGKSFKEKINEFLFEE